MINLGVVMDPISKINIKKDSTFAMLLEAQKRGYAIFYMEINNIYLFNNNPYAIVMKLINLKDNLYNWYQFGEIKRMPLKSFNIILMRKDPPVNMEYIYATYILEKAEELGVLVVNKAKSLRELNEKICILNFPNIIPNTIVTRDKKILHEFYLKNGDIIIKPLNAMGGRSVFRLKKNEHNLNVIFENMTYYGNKFCMAQKYLCNINKYGDKRILVIDGKPVKFCLTRMPINGETRANLAVGGVGKIESLTKNDLYIVKNVSSFLKKKGLLFVGLDVIDNYLTEINITSPTCIREIDNEKSISITSMLFDIIESKLQI